MFPKREEIIRVFANIFLTNCQIAAGASYSALRLRTSKMPNFK